MPDTCPTCDSPNQEEYRARSASGRWIPWWKGSQYSCPDLWHTTALRTEDGMKESEAKDGNDTRSTEALRNDTHSTRDHHHAADVHSTPGNVDKPQKVAAPAGEAPTPLAMEAATEIMFRMPASFPDYDFSR